MPRKRNTLKLPLSNQLQTFKSVELPTALLGLVRMFNNYSLLLEVLFGPNCPHYMHVRALRDGLEDNENDLEMRITKPLCLQLLWRVHQDAHQFLLACE